MIWEALALSLVLTVLLEAGAALLWGLRGRELLLCLLVNAMTNPPAVVLHARYPAWPATLALELAVTAAEGLCYARFSGVRRPWLLALTANGLSFVCGLALNCIL